MKVARAVAKTGVPAGGCTPAILLYDIETTPIEAYCWRTWNENIGVEQIKAPSEILCFAAKWLGRPEIVFLSRRGQCTDRMLCKAIREVLSKADIVVAHNGRAFDECTLRARWAKWSLPPPDPYRVVDTCDLARRAFNFPHNSLNGLAHYLGLGAKVEHEGFPLWLKCMAGDAAAWRTMEDYNVGDVLLLEKVYLRLRAYDKRHQNVGLIYEDDLARCVVCGAAALKELNKPVRTGVSLFDAYRCRKCGALMRSRFRLKIETNPVRGVF